MEECTRHIVYVASQRVNLPRFRIVHPPKLDLPVICTRYDQRMRMVECGPINTAIVAFQNVLDSCIVAAKKVLYLRCKKTE